MVNVYEWLTAESKPFGCGTEAEFHYWLSEGVNPEGSVLGKVLCQEPSSEDDRRKKLWAA